MRRSCLWIAPLAGVLCFVALESRARAEVFNTARTLKPGALSVAIAPQVFLEDPLVSELQLFFGVGLIRGLDLQLRYDTPLGGSGLPPYLGVDAEVGILRDRGARPAVSWTMGTHVEDWSQGGLDGTVMVSKVFGHLEPFAALDGNLEWTGGGAVSSLWLAGGLDVHLGRLVEFIVEGGTRLKQTGGYISLGFNLYLAPARR